MPRLLVTGAAQRLGRALALYFAERGWAVVIHANRSADDAERLARTIGRQGGRAEPVIADLADPEAADALIDRVTAQGPLHCLINNAALFLRDEAEAIDPAIFTTMMQVNLLAPARLAGAWARRIDGDADASVINILDQKLSNMNPDYFSYTISKAGLAAAGTMMAMKFAPALRVNAIAPGILLPSGDQSEADYARAAPLNLLRRRTDVDDVAAAAYFLATTRSITGETIFVDSGQHLTAQDRDVMFLARGDTPA